MEQPGILVLAAGMGSRYGGLKQLEPVGPNDETLLDYSVYDAIRTGFKRIVFIIRREIEEPFRKNIGERYQDKIEIDYAFQSLEDLPGGFPFSHRVRPWGTAHALWAARDHVTGSFAVINADDFYGKDAYSTMAAYFKNCDQHDEDPLAMVAYQLSHTLSRHGTVNRGLCRTREGMLQSVEEIVNISTDSTGGITGTDSNAQLVKLLQDDMVSMNFWGFSDRIFGLLQDSLIEFLQSDGASPKAEFYIPSFVDKLIHDRNLRCHVLRTDASWFGITYPADRSAVKEQIQALIDQGNYPSPLLT